MARPEGTKKRDAAMIAAQALLHGEHADLRSAALATFHRHAGGMPRDKIVEGHSEFDRFRDFVAYVEEAYRELIQDPKNHRRSLRPTFGPLNDRSANRRRQPSERRKFIAALKAKPHLKYIREMLGLPDPN